MGMPWSRVVNTTIKNYITGALDMTLRGRKLFALLKSRGRIEMNESGWARDWKVEYNTVRPTPWADGDTLQFSKIDRWKTATLDWRAYTMQDSMSKGEWLANRGKEAMVGIFDNSAKKLLRDMSNYIGEELYINGYAAGNSKRMHGLDSAFGTPSLNPATGVNLANNGFGWPVGTYAGLTLTPGAYNGNWDVNSNPNLFWPHGRGDTRYDFWSSYICDVGSPKYSSTNTWQANCVDAISETLTQTGKNRGEGAPIDLILTGAEMYSQFKKVFRPLERIEVTKDSGLRKLGFGDILNLDGCDVTSEYGIPQGVGYGLSLDEITLISQQSELFVAMGPDEDPKTKSWLWSVDFFGNLHLTPKCLVKFMNLTNSTDSI